MPQGLRFAVVIQVQPCTIDSQLEQHILRHMAANMIEVSLPPRLSGYIEEKIKDGRYENAAEVIREALRRMEASELAGELGQFERAFAGGHDRPETEEEIERIETAVRAGRISDPGCH